MATLRNQLLAELKGGKRIETFSRKDGPVIRIGGRLGQTDHEHEFRPTLVAQFYVQWRKRIQDANQQATFLALSTG